MRSRNRKRRCTPASWRSTKRWAADGKRARTRDAPRARRPKAALRRCGQSDAAQCASLIAPYIDSSEKSASIIARAGMIVAVEIAHRDAASLETPYAIIER